MSKRWSIFLLLCAILVLIYGINFYLITRFVNDNAVREKLANPSPSVKTIEKSLTTLIKEEVHQLKPSYVNKNPRYYGIRRQLVKTFQPASYTNASQLWIQAKSWPNDNEVYPYPDASLGALLKALRTEPLLNAYNFPRGTQLKLLLQLSGKLKVLFKPKWYARNRTFDGAVYAGKDRHNSEILAFYLGAALNLRWTPIAVGRKINLQEVYRIADDELRETMTINPNTTKVCLYGKCMYCKPTETVCDDENGMLEGVLLMVVPGSLVKQRSPWQRSYKSNKKTQWETDMDYCTPLKKEIPKIRLLDLIDTAIFDFITQNGDRHHYETRNERVILIDNGKGFGNPRVDFIDILAPLYQCCIMRRSTWERLLIFSGGNLSKILEEMTAWDELKPVLTREHFDAMNRRLLYVYAVVEICIQKHGRSIFI